MSDQRCRKFGLLQYPGTDNLGDEMQSLAARRFVPRVTQYLNREELNAVEAPGGQVYWTILNGWYSHLPATWPPSPAVRPLLVALHITRSRSASGLFPAEIMLAEPMVRYLRAAGPVGARDFSTLRMLRLAGVESYFSGCLTLTLERPRVARDGNLIVLNDVPDEVPGFVRAQTSKRIVTTTHSAGGELQAQNRFAMAQSLLALYARASCVVTARLHCAMPCIAIGTPVLFLAAAADKYRFSGLAEMAHSCSPEEFTSGRFRYDINSPPANKTLHLPYRASLKKTAMDFVNQADHGNGRGWYPLSERERRIPEKMAAAVAGSPCASDPWAQA